MSSTGCLYNGFFQVESHGVEEKLQLDLGSSEVPRAVKSMAALEGAESSLDFRADAADLTVGVFFRGIQLPVASGLVHDAVDKASNLKHIAIELAAVSLVRENTLADLRVDLIQDGDKFLCVGPVCRRGMAAEDKAVPSVRGGVDFVPVIGAVALA